MVANPMQRKARNSFLLGILVSLILCSIIFVLVYVLVINKDKEEEEQQQGEKVIAYVLNQDIKSGDVITTNLLTQIEVYDTMIPSNYINSIQLSNMTLQDENGNMLYTDAKGQMYINQSDNRMYLPTEDGKKERVLIQEDENGFYKTNVVGTKEYIELLSAPVIAKIDMYKNSILTADFVASSDQIVTDDTRYIEYNMLILPTTIMEGDYIDIRLTLPNGQDLIVVSKKEVKSILGDTIGMELTEDEILMMESAIVEAYIMTASKLYAIQYIEPGMQEAAIKTYVPTNEVRSLIDANPNIAASAKSALNDRFIKGVDGAIESGERAYINNAVNSYAASAQTNLEAGIQEQIENARKAREAYLSGLTSY